MVKITDARMQETGINLPKGPAIQFFLFQEDPSQQGGFFMKYRFVAFLAACIVLSGISIAHAADPTGKWVAQVPGREGQTREVTITLKAEGEKLTGTVSGRQGDNPIADGQIKGDDVSFTVAQNFQGNEVKVSYKGKVSGDEIKFTRTIGDRPPVDFTAKRAK
jgi:hypothetical protein